MKTLENECASLYEEAKMLGKAETNRLKDCGIVISPEANKYVPIGIRELMANEHS